jgi:hypothetical protein
VGNTTTSSSGAPSPGDDDWFQADDGYWSIKRGAWGQDIEFFEDELDDWPPLVALRAENARLHQLVDHLRAELDRRTDPDLAARLRWMPRDAYKYEDSVYETVDHGDERDRFDAALDAAARLLDGEARDD